MVDPKALLAKRLEALTADYRRQLPDRIDELTAALAAATSAAGDEARDAALVDLRRVAHRLVGSGKTFGLPHVSEAAAPIEHVADAILDGRMSFGDADIAAMIARLHETDPTPIPPPEPVPTSRPTVRVGRSEPAAEVGLIWLAGLAAEPAARLEVDLARYGFRTEAAAVDGLDSAIARRRPAAIIADLEALTLASPEPWDDPATPLLVLSPDGGIGTRLAAVRHGASGFQASPPDPDKLVDLLDRLLERVDPEPYRIVLVEDDDILASSFSATLEAEGMKVHRLADPLQILEACRTAAPDVVVTDLYLPQADGIEMAQVIRQHGGFSDVPILFVSSETNLNRQLAARRLGADDFLTKPLTSDQLVTAVTARAVRYRDLRRLMDRDSLTGLLNRGRTEARLAREIERCRASGDPLSVAVIDVDHFKRVNDTYGHATGDKVLRTLSRLLQQRLRGSDTAGRFGGEEFVVVLPGADAEAAFGVLDALRRAFEAVEHVSGEERFHSTYSGGLATLQDDDDGASVLARADAALYAAKHGGRNRIGLED